MVGLRQTAVARGNWSEIGEIATSRSQQPPWAPGASAPVKPRVAQLVRTIETEIIPRLVLAQRDAIRSSLPVAARTQQRKLDGGEIENFAALVLGQEIASIAAYINTMRAGGTSIEDIYLNLLAPAARRLGEFWVADLVDFTEVTIGVGRLQQILRELSPAFQNERECRSHGRRVLLSPAPSEQHSFGLIMVAEFFQRAGWDVWSDPALNVDEMVKVVRKEWFAVVGLSLSCEARLESLANVIRAIRRASRNRAVGVMVGGQVFTQHPELVALIGADAMATDGAQAVSRAGEMLALLAI